MESVEAEVRYHIITSLIKKFKMYDVWFVHFEGSRESLAIGFDEPSWVVGDEIMITVERTKHAKPSKPSE